MSDRRSTRMIEIIRYVRQAVRPVTAQQRFLWWCGTLLLASGAAHGVVAAVDGAAWWGPVSWRKPVVFALSFGILLWSAVWVMRHLPTRRWGWLPAGLLGGTSAIEVVLITMQRWRGVPSHFNAATGFDSAVWSVMGIAVIFVVLAVVLLLGWALVRFQGAPATRVAVLVGLVGVLASGYIGSDMAAMGEDTVTTTGHVPDGVVFGAAGSAKLAHAVGMHGLQLLGLLAVGLELARVRTGTGLRVMVLASLGYAAVFAATTGTAYAGRAWTSPTVPMALLLLAGASALLVAVTVTARRVLAAPSDVRVRESVGVVG